MTRGIIQHTKGFSIHIRVHRLGKKTKVIEYYHVLGSVDKRVYEEKSYEPFNYITKDHKEQVQKNKEFLEKLKSMEVNHAKV